MWHYYRDEIVSGDDNSSEGKSFEYKTKIAEKAEKKPLQRRNKRNTDQTGQPSVSSLPAEFTVPTKYLSNCLRSSNLLLINCKVELELLWAKDFVLSLRSQGQKFMS